MQASKLLEIVYFTLIKVPTAEGDLYCFFGVDEFSKFVFNLGVSKEFNDAVFLQHINNLLTDKSFSKNLKSDFTLVLSFGEQIGKQISELIAPHGGTLVFDEKLVDENAMPNIDLALRSLIEGD